ncbi:S41 family peptidase [Tuwongella immobilis]|uniref:Tricorn protease homolog n=1 Tax=Tuwongella immobilis TaxID=692036 RepID=A0A6C2YR88_9BACT|nr:S41 family peptidase [Tuwongella immobilis]VIP04170.1 protease : Uncharacterized protein OS=Odoribacter laneus CAG:561 GN=BN709_00892 PE=4 SV=1: PD40: PD40: PD40: Tricorn_C1: Tricorn_PDZ: Peptidase_S41 [Tuwongella immobilis]VTS05705.1 protease : Uncharacterized protein OS=Odoribacter laneus CAG:561 GN=BN709_00892 PE=4 SV=1: PD40: PD40: PD40: Tricorn_C1: Tricorn_PDZ: Peptidase_S41 [Tuwongella immobilis]
MSVRSWGIALLMGVLTLSGSSRVLAAEETRLLRFPTQHGDSVVFSYAGNLYTVALKGGVARRLTSHAGYEMFPRFSPDGKTIAFTGQYDGNTEVYTIPAEGGVPKRLTYTATLSRDEVSDRMGPNNIVMGWSPDGKRVLFRSRMTTFNDFLGQLYTVSVDGGPAEPLPLPRGGFASYSPDGKQLVYNRVFREFRTWKRYRGGMADDVWTYDFATKQTTRLVENAAQDIIPMWAGDTVYFISDRGDDQRMNLYGVNIATKEISEFTRFKEFDIKFPSLGDTSIVFENGGYIYRFDLQTKKTEKLTISIVEDFSEIRSATRNVSGNVGAFEISPDGKKALLGARGDLFTVPQENGLTKNLTATPGVHDRNPKWSPDGKSIAYISDASGEDEIYTIPADGSGPPMAVTAGSKNYKYDLLWSPDSKKIAWTDREQKLHVVDLATKKVSTIAESKGFEIRQYVWSPDSRWIAYVNPEVAAFSRVYLHSLETGKSTPVTDPFYTVSSPAFSGDGKYLFFVSNRDFNPFPSAVEWNYAYRDMSKIYLVTLSNETPNPFATKLDDVAATPPAPAAKKEGDAPAPIDIDLDGIIERTLSLPISAGNYGGLQSVGSSVWYQKVPGGLTLFDVGAKKETTLGNVNGFEISADGKKMIVAQGGKHYIIDLPKGPLNLGKPLDESAVEVTIDYPAEWKQIFVESWRQMRDFFYDPGMHGNDWAAIRKKYEPLVAHVRHRADLSYVIGEMISELNVGHAYVGGGELPEVKKVPMGLLGAQFTRDAETGYAKITKILKGSNWDRSVRAPLNELGLNISEGEFIIRVNGKPTNEVANIQQLLVNTADKPVILTINKTPEAKGSRQVVVTPVGSEANLYYHDWVQTNLKKVQDATNGEVGYLHVPDMLTGGLNEFFKAYFPQLGKKALIIDVRGNGGGNVSPILIERLRREIAMYSIVRNGVPGVEPNGTFNGPLVCLMNEFSASDGDIFPYRFKHYKLGTLIGKRSWGGTVGIRGTLPFLDGGTLNRPEFSRFGVDGKTWIIEGYGVDPDIVVDNDPAKEFAGIDEQLLEAIKVAKEKIRTEYKPVPPTPPYPKR